MTSWEIGSSDELSAAASSLRARTRYVSASDELTCPDSVINSAQDDEPVFVLRARDMVSPPQLSGGYGVHKIAVFPRRSLKKQNGNVEPLICGLIKNFRHMHPLKAARYSNFSHRARRHCFDPKRSPP